LPWCFNSKWQLFSDKSKTSLPKSANLSNVDVLQCSALNQQEAANQTHNWLIVKG
jgi:hypothetical protein